jgi:hypothetical protein
VSDAHQETAHTLPVFSAGLMAPLIPDAGIEKENNAIAGTSTGEND